MVGPSVNFHPVPVIAFLLFGLFGGLLLFESAVAGGFFAVFGIGVGVGVGGHVAAAGGTGDQ